MTGLLALLLALMLGAFVASMLLLNALLFLVAGCLREAGVLALRANGRARRGTRLPAAD